MTRATEGPRPEAGIWTRVRDAVEGGFEIWGHIVYRRAWSTIVLALLLVAGLASQIPRLELDTSTEGMLAEGDPVRTAYDDFRRRFGRDEMIILAIYGSGDDIFDLEFLERLRRLHEDIEAEVPKLHEVTSLVNVRYTHGVGEELVVGDFLEDWPETDQDLALLRERALANPLYRDQLISADGRVTTIIVQTDAFTSEGISEDALAGFTEDDDGFGDAEQSEDRAFLTGAENTEIVNAMNALIARHQAPDFRILGGGNPMMIDAIMSGMLTDMGIFAVFSLVAVSLFLALLFRSVVAVALSLVVSVFAVVCSLATMAIIAMPLAAPTQIMPSFLLAVGVGNSVHVLVIYFQARGRGEDVEGAIAYSLSHSGLAIVMTALTTAGGLMSFVSAEIAPVVDVGIICPIGTMIALVFSLVLLPALIAVVPMRTREEGAWRDDSLLRRLPIRCGEIGTTHPVATALVWALILGFAIAGAVQVRFSHYPIAWFDEAHPLRLATERINEDLHGSITLEVLVDSGEENGLHDPDLLHRIDAMQRFAEGVRTGDLYIGKTVSIVDVVKETHQALNENREAYYAIPDDRELIAQELLLFENSGSDDLLDVVDSQFRVGRVTLKLPMVDAVGFDVLLQKLEAGFGEILGDRATFTLTGNWSILGRTVNALMHSLSKTYVFAFATITPLMMLLLGSARLGLLSMIPNMSAIVITVGFMGWFGVPLDAFTLMVGSIALGLAVDDTIHFMHNFRRAYSRVGDAHEAVLSTLASTGQALFFTSLVLSTGFFIYMFASMENLYYFGLLTGAAIAFAFCANVTLAPALVTLLAQSGASRVLRSEGAQEPGPGETPDAGVA